MNIMDYVFLGIFINFIVITTFCVWAYRVRDEIGYQLYDRLIEDAPRYSTWVLVLWLVPFIGLCSAINALYKWHRIDTENLVERLDKFIHTPPGFISKYFLLKEPTTNVEGA